MLSNELGVLDGLRGRVVPGSLFNRTPVLVLLLVMMMMVVVVALERRAGQPVVRGGRRAEHVVVLVLGVQLDRVLVLVRRHVHHGVVGTGHSGHAAAAAADAVGLTRGAYGPGAAVPGRRQRGRHAVVETVAAVVAQVLVDLGRHVEHARQDIAVLLVVVLVVLVDRVALLRPLDQQHLGQYLDEQLHHPRSHPVRHRRPVRGDGTGYFRPYTSARTCYRNVFATFSAEKITLSKFFIINYEYQLYYYFYF